MTPVPSYLPRANPEPLSSTELRALNTLLARGFNVTMPDASSMLERLTMLVDGGERWESILRRLNGPPRIEARRGDWDGFLEAALPPALDRTLVASTPARVIEPGWRPSKPSPVVPPGHSATDGDPRTGPGDHATGDADAIDAPGRTPSCPTPGTRSGGLDGRTPSEGSERGAPPKREQATATVVATRGLVRTIRCACGTVFDHVRKPGPGRNPSKCASCR